MPNDLKAMRWFDTVRDACDDLDDTDERGALIDAVIAASEYYSKAKEDAAAKMVMQNTLENLLVENTGFAFFYNGIHTDALQVRKYLEFMLDHYESKKYVWFQTSADGRAMLGTKPTATDLRNHIKADDIVVTLNDCIRLIADRQHEMEVVRDGFNVRGYNLKTITDIRVAKLEEVWIDGTRETKNT